MTFNLEPTSNTEASVFRMGIESRINRVRALLDALRGITCEVDQGDLPNNWEGICALIYELKDHTDMLHNDYTAERAAEVQIRRQVGTLKC